MRTSGTVCAFTILVQASSCIPPRGEVEITSGPTTRPAASAEIRLVQILEVSTAVPTRLTVVLDDARPPRQIEFPDVETTHVVPLLGLGVGANAVTVRLQANDGSVSVVHVTVDAGATFDPGPDLTVLVRDPGRMELGYTLFPTKGLDSSYTVLQAVDDSGNIVWQYRPTPTPERDQSSVTSVQFHPLDGQLSALVNRTRVHLFDPAMTADVTWAPAVDAVDGDIAVDVDPPFHHEAVFEPDGSFWTLIKNDDVSVQDFPLDETDLSVIGPADLEVDGVAHVGADGQVLGSWLLTDYLDTHRTGWDVTPRDPDTGALTPGDGLYKWSNATAVVPLMDDEQSFVVVVCNQDAVVRIRGSADELVWIFGNHAGWATEFEPYWFDAPPQDFLWPAHQTGAALAEGGQLLLFDNGDHGRTNPYVTEPVLDEVSRLVRYDIDEDGRTATQADNFVAGGFNPLFSRLLGHVETLPVTGNLLGTWGSLDAEGGVINTDAGLGLQSVRIIEIDPDDGSTVWDLRANSTLSESSTGWQSDRAIRIPSLYPSDVTVTLLD